jgi:hypothetical protein
VDALKTKFGEQVFHGHTISVQSAGGGCDGHSFLCVGCWQRPYVTAVAADVPEHVEILTGEQGLSKVLLKHSSGAAAEVSEHIHGVISGRSVSG